MVKQAESLWSESQSQPRPLFETPPEARDSTRARLWVQRAVALAAGVAAVIFLLYVFWLRAAPPLLFGPLGSVGDAEQGRNSGLWDGSFLGLIDGLSPALDERDGTRLGESNAIATGNGARITESTQRNKGGTNDNASGRTRRSGATGVAALAGSHFGTGEEHQGSEPRRAPGVGAGDELGSGGSPGAGGGNSGQGQPDDGNGGNGGNGNGNGGDTDEDDDEDADEGEDEDQDDEDEDDDDDDDEDGGLL
jgi:hypothetical protein